jgi:hypothetical protein
LDLDGFPEIASGRASLTFVGLGSAGVAEIASAKLAVRGDSSEPATVDCVRIVGRDVWESLGLDPEWIANDVGLNLKL